MEEFRFEDDENYCGFNSIEVPRIAYRASDGSLIPKSSEVFDGDWEYIARWEEGYIAEIETAGDPENESDEDYFARTEVRDASFSLQHLDGRYRLVEHLENDERITTRLSETQALHLWATFNVETKQCVLDLVKKMLTQVVHVETEHPSIESACKELDVAQQAIFRYLLSVTSSAWFHEGLDELEVWSPTKGYDRPAATTVFNRLTTIKNKVRQHGFVFVPNRKGWFRWITRPDRFG